MLADQDQLLLVLTELARNAQNAIGNKSGFIKLAARTVDDRILISVSDDGPGIASQIKGRLFSEPIPTDAQSGMGLYLVGKMVTAWGGEIKVEATAKPGACVTISLVTK